MFLAEVVVQLEPLDQQVVPLSKLKIPLLLNLIKEFWMSEILEFAELLKGGLKVLDLGLPSVVPKRLLYFDGR